MHQVLVSRCSSVEVGTDQEVDAEEANAAHPPYMTPAAASVTMASSISLLNKSVVLCVLCTGSPHYLAVASLSKGTRGQRAAQMSLGNCVWSQAMGCRTSDLYKTLF